MSDGACSVCFSRDKAVEDGGGQPSPKAKVAVRSRGLGAEPTTQAAEGNGDALAKAKATLDEGEAKLDEAKQKIEKGEALLRQAQEQDKPAPAPSNGPLSRIVTFMKPKSEETVEAEGINVPLIGKTENEELPTEEEHDLVCAAWIIEDALDGHHADEYPVGDEAKAFRTRVHRLLFLKSCLFYSTILLVAMMFVEVPLWCKPSPSADFNSFAVKEYCPLKDDDYYNAIFVSNVIPPKYSMTVELIAMIVLTAALGFEYQLSQALGPKRRMNGSMPGRFLIILVLMWIDLVVYYVSWTSGSYTNFRFAPYGRIALLFYGTRVRAVFSSTVQCLDEFGSVCVFLMGCVLFFSWMFYNVVDDIHDATGKSVGEVAGDDDNFGSFAKTVITMFTIMTGAAFPDDVTAVLKQSHWYSLIFYPFMGFSFFLFTQLMLAVVYNAYSGETEENLKKFYIARSKGLAKTFSLLAVENSTGDKVIKTDTFTNLVGTLATWPRFKGRLRKQDSEVLFEALDDDGSGELSMNEFFDACSTLQYTIWTCQEKTGFVSRARSSESPSKFVTGLDDFVSNGTLNNVTQVILTLNAVFIVVQSYFDFTDKLEPKAFNTIEFFFSVIYMAEVILKLTVYSCKEYFSSPANKFDFTVSWVLFIGGTLSYFNIRTGLPLDTMMQYFNILRILRLLRLLTQVPRLRKMCTCITKVVMVSGDMVILFFISTQFLAIIGVQGFGGLIYDGAPNMDDDDLDFNDAGFDVLNFNDMTGAFLALMDMMVTAYQPEYAQVMDLVLPIELPIIGAQIGECYCGLVFFLSVNIAFNIFTAFLIDIFVSLEEAEDEGEESEEDQNLASMRDKLKETGEVLHFLMPPEVLRLRTLTGVIDGLDDAIKDAQDEALGIKKDDDDDDAKGGEGGEDGGDSKEKTLTALVQEVLSFRSESYQATFLKKLQKESIMSPSDLLVVSKQAMEEKLSTASSFQFVELADTMRLRDVAEKL